MRRRERYQADLAEMTAILERKARMADNPFGQAQATREEFDAIKRAGQIAHMHGIGSTGASSVEDGSGHYARVVWEKTGDYTIQIYTPGKATLLSPEIGGTDRKPDTVHKVWMHMPDVAGQGRDVEEVPVELVPINEDGMGKDLTVKEMVATGRRWLQARPHEDAHAYGLKQATAHKCPKHTAAQQQEALGDLAIEFADRVKALPAKS